VLCIRLYDPQLLHHLPQCSDARPQVDLRVLLRLHHLVQQLHLLAYTTALPYTTCVCCCCCMAAG
jgi:hypothetical protein